MIARCLLNRVNGVNEVFNSLVDHLQCLLEFSDGFQFWRETVNEYAEKF